MKGARVRHQLVVSLGEGASGLEAKKALCEAATARGMSLSEWARDVLFAAAGKKPEGSVEERLGRLEARVHELWNMQRL